jgi:hypothetical protein
MWSRPYQRASSKLLAGLAVVVALSLIPVAPAATQAQPVRITQVGVKAFGETLQLAVVGSGALTYRTLQLSAPPRLVIDLPGAVLDASVPSVIEVERGGVARIRTGQFQTRPPIARVTVDLAAAVPFTLATTAPGVLVARFDTRAVAPVAAAPRREVPARQIEAQAPAQPAAPAPADARVAQVPPTPPGRITLEFRATEIADVLSALAKVCNVNIVTDAAVRGQITVRLVDLTCDESLRFILEANNLGFRRIGRNLIILPAERLAPPPEAPESITYPIGFGVAREIADAIRAAVPGIRVTHDVRTNTVVVVATPAQHEEVRKILAGLDIQLVQVMIESRVVDISMSDLRDLGLSWGLTGVPIIGIEGVFPNQITVGVADFTILARLNALVTERKARVITAPRIAVVDGNEAEVNLGEDIPIPSIDAAGRLTFDFKPVGVLLKILPKVNRDGLVTTRIAPEVSSVIEFLPTPSGPVPRIATRKASTVVTARSGAPIVLAGLISAEERRTVLKVPLLGDIPILGALFRTATTDRRESEVIFVVTMQVLPATGQPAPPLPAPAPRPSP